MLFGFLALGLFWGLATGGSGGGGLAGIAAVLTALQGFKKDKDKDEKKDENSDKKEGDKKEEKPEKEGDKKDDNTLMRNKALAVMKKRIDSGEASEEEVSDFNTVLSCTFDENGEELSPEMVSKNIEALPQDVKDRINKNLKAAAKDPEALKEFQAEADKVTEQEAAAAVLECKAIHVENESKKKIAKLEKEMNDEIAALGEKPDENELKNIKDKFQKQIDAEKARAKSLSDKFRADAKKAKGASTDDESTAKLEKELSDLENKKKELENKDEANKALEDKIKSEIEKDSFNGLTIAEIENPSSDEKKKQRDEYMKSIGISDPALLVEYKNMQNASPEEKEEKEKAFKEKLDKEREKQIKDIDKQISDKKKEIENSKKTKEANTGTQQNNNTTTKTEEKDEYTYKDEDGKEVVVKREKQDDGSYKYQKKVGDGEFAEATEDDFKSAKDKQSKEPEPKTKEPEAKTGEDNSFEDEDGYVYKKDGDKYTMTDDKGQEIEIDKEEFEKAKEKAVDDEKEGDERTDNDDDLEDDEVDDKGNSTGKKDPRKIYKRRTYKRGDKTFKTKSYYDKKGNSISAKDFKEKVANFEKSNKQKNESFNISNFLKDKLIVERFYPRDITNYLQEHLR